jgi:hypothetical protein
MLTKIIQISIPADRTVPEIMNTFTPEENFFALKIGSDSLREGRNVIIGLSQKEMYNKVKEENKEEIKKLEMEILLEREMIKRIEDKLSSVYESQMDQIIKWKNWKK